ncbi:MAG: alanine racemase [Anaerolineales bacterium]|nr:alanine racemase [Anaerolineales bacterium]
MPNLTQTSTLLKSLGITRPTLILDHQQTLLNIASMAHKAQNAAVRLRPHGKTHQSAAVGKLCHMQGIHTITASSLDMALYFAANGWDDITDAIPVNTLEIDKINHLASKIKLNLLVDHPAAVSALAAGLTHPVRIWLEADLGYKRTGVSYENLDQALAIAQQIEQAEQMRFVGLLTHAGHTYVERSVAGITAVYQQVLTRLQVMQNHLLQNGIARCAISIGDTPACSVLNDFTGVDEIRPGNFVFYDLMQAQIGSCTSDQISVAVACPVIGLYPERQTAVIHGGGVHFAKDMLTDDHGRALFGQLTTITDGTFSGALPAATLTSVSQEHGTLTLTDPTLFNQLSLGDLVLVLPVHSCMTADLYSSYLDLDGQRYGRIPRQP